MTPPMHPLVWLKDDFTWLGGGQTGVDGAAERRFIVLETGGHTLLISLANDPSTFEARNAEFQTILDSDHLRVANGQQGPADDAGSARASALRARITTTSMGSWRPRTSRFRRSSPFVS